MNIIDFGSGDESRIAEHYRARPDATSSYRRSLHDLGVPTETQITVHCIDPLLTRESEMPTETENTQIQTYRHISELTCEKVNGILVIHPNPLVHSVLFERRGSSLHLRDDEFMYYQFPGTLVDIVEDRLVDGGFVYWQEDDEYVKFDPSGKSIQRIASYTDIIGDPHQEDEPIFYSSIYRSQRAYRMKAGEPKKPKKEERSSSWLWDDI